MLATILALLVVGFVAYVVTPPEERERLFLATIAFLRRARATANFRLPGLETFGDALCARTPRVLVVPAIVATNITIFVCMLGASGDTETLIAWGANVGPRTSNGEWWRLVSSMFVHSGFVHLAVNIIGFVQIGMLLERLLGPLAFAGAYLAAGVCASLACLFVAPVEVSAGASAAILGMYGLLIACWMWSFFVRSGMTIPMRAVRVLLPAAGVFALHILFSDATRSAAQVAGVVAGLVYGLVLPRRVGQRKPTLRLVGGVAAATVVMIVAAAVPLRGIVNVAPVIDATVTIERKCAATYTKAVDEFKNGWITHDALALVIDRTIIPDMQAAAIRVEAFDRVPDEHQPLLVDAAAYFRLRIESWRLRSRALHTSNLLMLRRADTMERASLEALRRLRPAAEQ